MSRHPISCQICTAQTRKDTDSQGHHDCIRFMVRQYETKNELLFLNILWQIRIYNCTVEHRFSDSQWTLGQLFVRIIGNFKEKRKIINMYNNSLYLSKLNVFIRPIYIFNINITTL